jgi:hypothetical protein
LSEDKLEDAAAKIDKGVIERMQKSFTRNQKANEEFLRTAQEQSPTLRSVSIPVLLRSQTYFSLIVSLASLEEWLKAAKETYIFPFCENE